MSCYGDDPFEKPIILNHETQFVGTLPFSKHPDGMCMPCCFKKQGMTEKAQ